MDFKFLVILVQCAFSRYVQDTLWKSKMDEILGFYEQGEVFGIYPFVRRESKIFSIVLTLRR